MAYLCFADVYTAADRGVMLESKIGYGITEEGGLVANDEGVTFSIFRPGINSSGEEGPHTLREAFSRYLLGTELLPTLYATAQLNEGAAKLIPHQPFSRVKEKFRRRYRAEMKDYLLAEPAGDRVNVVSKSEQPVITRHGGPDALDREDTFTGTDERLDRAVAECRALLELKESRAGAAPRPGGPDDLQNLHLFRYLRMRPDIEDVLDEYLARASTPAPPALPTSSRPHRASPARSKRWSELSTSGASNVPSSRPKSTSATSPPRTAPAS